MASIAQLVAGDVPHMPEGAVRLRVPPQTRRVWLVMGEDRDGLSYWSIHGSMLYEVPGDEQ